MKSYVNFHNHTHGSLLDGVSRPKIYAKAAKDDGAPAISSTDHGNLHILLDMKDAADDDKKKGGGEPAHQDPGEAFDRSADRLNARCFRMHKSELSWYRPERPEAVMQMH